VWYMVGIFGNLAVRPDHSGPPPSPISSPPQRAKKNWVARLSVIKRSNGVV